MNANLFYPHRCYQQTIMIPQKENYYWLDLLRGIAALLVFLSHIRILYFLDYPDIKHTIFSSFIYYITGFGHSSVIVFFVLSGFFIVGTIQKAIHTGTWSLPNYLLDRVIRLWVVLIPALLFTLFIDKLGALLHPSSFAYLAKIGQLWEINPANKSGLIMLTGNLFFIQTILVPTFGTNTPLWSLAYEFWYYVSFPVIYLAFLFRKHIGTSAVYALLFILILLFAGKDIAAYYVIWLMGGIVYYLHSILATPRIQSYAIYIIVSLFVLSLTCVRLNLYTKLFNDFTLGVITSILVFLLLKRNMRNRQLRNIAVFTSKISYTLYLFHMPLSVFIISLVSQDRITFSISQFCVFSGYCALVFLLSYSIWWLFERNTYLVKRWVKQLLAKNEAVFIQK